jgi:hypothetical protein
MPVTDEQKVLFNFFVDRGLKQYAEGLGTELQQLAESTSRQAKEEAERHGVRFFSADPHDVAESAAFLDRFEDRFYESWRAVLDHKKKTDKDS